MTSEERQAEIARLRADNREALSTPLMSEGSISPMQVGMMSARQKEHYQQLTMRRMSVESEIKCLSRSDEEIARDESETAQRDRAVDILRLTRHIEWMERLGISSKTGKMRPKYQREIDKAQAELKTLTEAA